YTVFCNSSISDEHVFCVALHFTTGPQKELRVFYRKNKDKYPVKNDSDSSSSWSSDDWSGGGFDGGGSSSDW
ncbi:hypothetical protein K1I68_08720, partial [Streptococcus infantis]|nr:hypothetical protein [Streptococcus infantis]